MKARILRPVEVDIRTCQVKAGVRYWEDATVDGVEDTEGLLIPCREGSLWCPEIDVDSGTILNWRKGVKAKVHYKVCDSGSYYLRDAEGKDVLWIEEDYVPNGLIPGKYGDYIEMDIDAEGRILNWPKSPHISEFEGGESDED